MGTWVHDIECHPGQGAKLARAAGTYAKIIKEPAPQCLVRLPSGVEKLIDSRCRATIGIVSNPNHDARKLRKAGQSRWLGRPILNFFVSFVGRTHANIILTLSRPIRGELLYFIKNKK